MSRTLTISDELAAALGLSEEALRALIAEGEASGPPVPWDPEAAREEARRHFAASKPK